MTASPFYGDFAAQVATHVAVIDALVEGRVAGLRDAHRELDALGLGPCVAVAVLVGGVRFEGVSLEGAGDPQALRRFVEEALEREGGASS